MASPAPVKFTLKDFEEEVNKIGTNECKTILSDLKKYIEKSSPDIVKNRAEKLQKEIETRARVGMSEDALKFVNKLRTTGRESDVTVDPKTGTTVLHIEMEHGLKEDNKRLAKANDNKIAELEEKLTASQQTVQQLETEKKTFQQTVQQLGKDKKDAEDAYNKSCVEHAAEKTDLEKNFNSYIYDKEQVNTKLESILNQLQQTNDQLENKLRKANKEIEGWKDQLQQLAEDNARQKQKLSEEIHRLHRENKELKSRVSELAGAKLMDNNPDIADLSDPNRALKLGEKFSSLYDDDWTDAYQTYTEKFNMKEDEAIYFLLQVLLKTYEFCRKVADEQMDCLCNVFENPCQDIPKVLTMKPQKEKPQITQKQYKDLKDLRKQIGLRKAGSITKQYISKEYEEVKKGDKKLKSMLDETKGYYEKCVEVCWPMVLLDPPVKMEYPIKPGVKIDPTRFRLFGGSGEILDYVVWPPLVVVGGGLLAKGVAKAKKNTARAAKKP